METNFALVIGLGVVAAEVDVNERLRPLEHSTPAGTNACLGAESALNPFQSDTRLLAATMIPVMG